MFKVLDSTLPGCFPESRVGMLDWLYPGPTFSLNGALWRCGLLGASGIVSVDTCILLVKSHLYLISYSCQKEGASTD